MAAVGRGGRGCWDAGRRPTGSGGAPDTPRRPSPRACLVGQHRDRAARSAGGRGAKWLPVAGQRDRRGARRVAQRLLRGESPHRGRLSSRGCRLFRRPFYRAGPVPAPPCAHDEHLECLQRLRREEPLLPRHPSLFRTTLSAGIPAQAGRPREPGRRRRCAGSRDESARQIFEGARSV